MLTLTPREVKTAAPSLKLRIVDCRLPIERLNAMGESTASRPGILTRTHFVVHSFCCGMASRVMRPFVVVFRGVPTGGALPEIDSPRKGGGPMSSLTSGASGAMS